MVSLKISISGAHKVKYVSNNWYGLVWTLCIFTLDSIQMHSRAFSFIFTQNFMKEKLIRQKMCPNLQEM